MSGRMDWDRVNREKRAARAAAADPSDQLLPSSVSALEWDAATWNRLRSNGWISKELVTRPGKRARRKAARNQSRAASRNASPTHKQARAGSDVRNRDSRKGVDHRSLRVHGSEFSWSISCGCGKHLGKRGLGTLHDLFTCFRSHVGSADQKALAGHDPFVTDGQGLLVLSCSCEQMTTEFADLSQAALRWLQHAAAVAAQ